MPPSMLGLSSRFLALALLLGVGCIGSGLEDRRGAAALPPGISQELVDAARANLERVSREIDGAHLGNYGLPGSTAQQFVDAVILEYRAHPDLLKRRLETLASMVFFSAPEVTTGAVGRLTPFHGMDDAAFEALMANEDLVFEHHMEVNDGSPNGVRPFSVCETRFLISISKRDPQVDPQHAFTEGDRITSYDAYAQAFKNFAATCPQADLDEWYNFRGLGGLRPSWLESNISDRFLRRMASSCENPPANLVQDCQDWNADRLAYRDRKNTEIALREVYYDPRPEAVIAGVRSEPAEGCYCGQHRAEFDCLQQGCLWGDAGHGAQCAQEAYPSASSVCALDGDEASCTADAETCRWNGTACAPKNDWAATCGALAAEEACDNHESGNCYWQNGSCQTWGGDDSVEDPCTGHANAGDCTADVGCGWVASTGNATACRWLGEVQAPDACAPPGEMTFEQYMLNPDNAGVFVEDRNGDGIGEWIANGTLRAREGAKIVFASGASFTTPVDVVVTLKNAAALSGENGDVNLAAGTQLTVPAGSSLQFTRRTERRADSQDPLRLNANTELKVAEYTTLKQGANELTTNGDVTVKLAAALSIPLAEGGRVTVSIDAGSQQFSGDIHANIPLQGGAILTGSVIAGDVIAYDAVDPGWDRSMLGTADLGLETIFADGSGCTGSAANPATCGLVRRFYSLIDRHENFYQTYTSLRPDSSRLGQQPSPFVACSITLAASHAWDSAGTPSGGSAGFIYLMRIPFRQIFAGDVRSISTLGLSSGASNPLEAGPQVTTVQELYEHGAHLDMSRLWFDIATLSNNEYSSEHEVSKFGSVPAEQIEGILVIRRPAAMGGTPGEGDDDGEG